MAETEVSKTPNSLLELTQFYLRICESLVASEGEMSPELEAELKSFDIRVAHKLEAYHFVMERLKSDALWHAQIAAKHSGVAKTMKGAAERIKENIKSSMKTMGLSEVFGHTVRFLLSNAAPSLDIDPKVLPKEWKMEVTTWEPDKERIRKALAEGKMVPGAKLLEGKSLRPYPARKPQKEITT